MSRKNIPKYAIFLAIKIPTDYSRGMNWTRAFFVGMYCAALGWLVAPGKSWSKQCAVGVGLVIFCWLILYLVKMTL